MEAQVGRILTSIVWTIPLIACILGIVFGRAVFRIRMIGFSVPLMLVTVSYWVLALSPNLGLTEDAIRPYFQMSQMALAPVIAFQIYMTFRHYQEEENAIDRNDRIRERFEQLNNELNGT